MPEIPLIRDINLCEITRDKNLKANTTKEQSILRMLINNEKKAVSKLNPFSLFQQRNWVLKPKRDVC